MQRGKGNQVTLTDVWLPPPHSVGSICPLVSRIVTVKLTLRGAFASPGGLQRAAAWIDGDRQTAVQEEGEQQTQQDTAGNTGPRTQVREQPREGEPTDWRAAYA